ncbi:hypothetical protein [Nodularia sp. UHCC 0506]|uniref:hypothetical protein n=1 Tax=Nodularia sp. UHCC 0506 TaxID=3110243 RepID=UPI002B1FD59B|nr:hypothetical protein [Nodularia sp. UHCC 0506]MEA5512551.1 hypothetical protein [Nodularia sp. UHCC 0506]
MYIIHEGFGKICGSSAFLFGVGILAVSESENGKSGKQCILNQDGRDKLDQKLKEKYENGVNKSALHKEIGTEQISYDTLCKILDKPKKAVTRKFLDILFSFLGIDLEESDYDNPPKQEPSNGTKKRDIQNRDDKPTIEKLKNALEKLNYKQQKDLFDDAIEPLKPAATFLIHGKKNYGQQWLVNLLRYQHLPLYTTDVWQHKLEIQRRDANIENIWRKLQTLLNTQDSAPQTLVDELYKHWQTRPVILVLYIEHIVDNYLEEFINKFWKPLVDMVIADLSESKNNRLVLFLVDNANSQAKVKKYLLEKPDNNESYKPLKLEQIEHFNPQDVESWAGIQCNYQLFSQLWNDSTFNRDVMAQIVENHTTPIAVFTKICECCDLNWHDIETTLAL